MTIPGKWPREVLCSTSGCNKKFLVSPNWEERRDGMLHKKRYCEPCHRHMRESRGKKPFKKATKIKKAVTKDIPRVDPFQKKEFKKSKTIGQAGIDKAREMLAAGSRLASISNSLKIEEDVVAKALGIKGEQKVEAVQMSLAQELRTDLELAHVRQPDKNKRKFYADCAGCENQFKLPPNYLAWDIQLTTLCRVCRDGKPSKTPASIAPVVIEVPAKKTKPAISPATPAKDEPKKTVSSIQDEEEQGERIEEVDSTEANPYLIALEQAKADHKAAQEEQLSLKKRLEELEDNSSKLGFVVRSLEELVGASK